MSAVAVDIMRLPHGADLPLPEYATPDSAGVDLLAAVSEDVSLAPGERTLIPTGIALSLPRGYEAQIRPRSGLALKNGLTLLNTPGTIDADYRGEVKVALINLGQEPVEITPHMRIAQLIIAPVSRAEWQEVDELPDTERGEGDDKMRVGAGHRLPGDLPQILRNDWYLS